MNNQNISNKKTEKCDVCGKDKNKPWLFDSTSWDEENVCSCKDEQNETKLIEKEHSIGELFRDSKL